MGGWPTIRYYNKATGILGKSYEKKTDMAMCDELGPKGEHYMKDYVLEAGNTSLCKAQEPYTGCSEKEIKFIKKAAELAPDDKAKQQTRLEKMKGQKMKSELRDWLNQRLAILKQLTRDEL